MSTPKALQLPSGVRRLTIETGRGKFAVLEALPPSGVRERQPALLVPGYTGSKEDFLLILQALAAAGRQVVAIDMRGQYETPGADDPAAYQLGELAADVALVAGWLGEGQDGPASGRAIHLLGHSLGGLVTRELLLAGTAPISSLTLMSSGPGALTGPRAQVLQDLLAELDGIGPAGLGPEIERIWQTRLEPEATAGGVPPAIIDFLRTRLLSSSPTGLRAMAQTLLTCPDRTRVLARQDAAPVMVLYGENDDAWEPAAQEDMAAGCVPSGSASRPPRTPPRWRLRRPRRAR